MTAMTSGPLTVDSLLSYACLDRDDVRIVLALPDDTDVAGPRVVVRFQDDATRFRAPATLEHSSGRSHVEVTVPRDQIADGVWHLRLREGRGSPWRGLGARLLVHGDQPVALLFGKTANIA
jgi:hypothetical protein